MWHRQPSPDSAEEAATACPSLTGQAAASLKTALHDTTCAAKASAPADALMDANTCDSMDAGTCGSIDDYTASVAAGSKQQAPLSVPALDRADGASMPCSSSATQVTASCDGDKTLHGTERPIGGRFWCPVAGCSRQHGAGSKFRGYAVLTSLARHMQTEHVDCQHCNSPDSLHADADADVDANANADCVPESTQSQSPDSAEPRTVSRASSSDPQEAALDDPLLPIQSLFWCPDPECPKRRGNQAESHGYRALSGLRRHVKLRQEQGVGHQGMLCRRVADSRGFLKVAPGGASSQVGRTLQRADSDGAPQQCSAFGRHATVPRQTEVLDHLAGGDTAAQMDPASTSCSITAGVASSARTLAGHEELTAAQTKAVQAANAMLTAAQTDPAQAATALIHPAANPTASAGGDVRTAAHTDPAQAANALTSPALVTTAPAVHASWTAALRGSAQSNPASDHPEAPASLRDLTATMLALAGHGSGQTPASLEQASMNLVQPQLSMRAAHSVSLEQATSAPTEAQATPVSHTAAPSAGAATSLAYDFTAQHGIALNPPPSDCSVQSPPARSAPALPTPHFSAPTAAAIHPNVMRVGLFADMVTAALNKPPGTQGAALGAATSAGPVATSNGPGQPSDGPTPVSDGPAPVSEGPASILDGPAPISKCPAPNMNGLAFHPAAQPNDRLITKSAHQDGVTAAVTPHAGAPVAASQSDSHSPASRPGASSTAPAAALSLPQGPVGLPPLPARPSAMHSMQAGLTCKQPTPHCPAQPSGASALVPIAQQVITKQKLDTCKVQPCYLQHRVCSCLCVAHKGYKNFWFNGTCVSQSKMQL